MKMRLDTFVDPKTADSKSPLFASFHAGWYPFWMPLPSRVAFFWLLLASMAALNSSPLVGKMAFLFILSMIFAEARAAIMIVVFRCEIVEAQRDGNLQLLQMLAIRAHRIGDLPVEVAARLCQMSVDNFLLLSRAPQDNEASH